MTAIRFFKGALNTGVHTGSLWEHGHELAPVTFVGETSSGWQRATLSTPVNVVPGETYVVSYFAPGGGYSITTSYFAADVVSGRIAGPATGNGRYLYGAGGGFPTNSYRPRRTSSTRRSTFAAPGPPSPTRDAESARAADADPEPEPTDPEPGPTVTPRPTQRPRLR